MKIGTDFKEDLWYLLEEKCRFGRLRTKWTEQLIFWISFASVNSNIVKRNEVISVETWKLEVIWKFSEQRVGEF